MVCMQSIQMTDMVDSDETSPSHVDLIARMKWLK